MTFWVAFTEHLPTLLLISLDATAGQIGLQRAFLPGLQLIQLPTLRAISRVSKRAILIAGQLFALGGALPLLLIDVWSGDDLAITRWLVLLSLALVALGLNVSNMVWFPLLRSYVEAEKTGQFFGLLRSGWCLALMIYYAGAQFWLARHPGEFTPLFVVAFGLGVARVAIIARLPERSERTRERIRAREALALVRDQPKLRRYLIGVALCGAVRTSAFPFVIVMMRREIGFSDAQVMIASFLFYAGGLASLYVWGRICDRVGPAPVFRITSVGMAGLLAMLVMVDQPSASDFGLVLAFWGGFAIFNAGFGLADTQVLFGLTPSGAPARTLVIAGVLTSSVLALAPVGSGLALGQMLEGHRAPIDVYHGFFVIAAIVQLLVVLPLRRFGREAT
jgi:predicted MFS family arabinose efflux permease